MRIGRKLRGGEIIEITGDLGSGKTAFVRGLAKGMGSKDQVRSPSFTLSNRYVARDKALYHFDFYRLDDPGIMKRELAEVLEDPRAAVALEWADSVEEVLPAERLNVNIQATGDNARRISFSCPDSLKYLNADNT